MQVKMVEIKIYEGIIFPSFRSFVTLHYDMKESTFRHHFLRYFPTLFSLFRVSERYVKSNIHYIH